MTMNKVRVAITHGDTNSIGYEIIIKALSDPQMTELCTPIVYGTQKLLAFHAKALGMPLDAHLVSTAEAAVEDKVNLVNCAEEDIPVTFGRPNEASAKAALLSLDMAVKEVLSGTADVLVTAPISKAAMQSIGFPYSGHTEYLAAQCPVAEKAVEPLMILSNRLVRVALATTHLPISQVPAAITRELITEKAKQYLYSLQRDYRLSAPRIALLSLNPHCGDNGLLGTEEQTVIGPAIHAMQEESLPVFGPFPADGFFGAGLYGEFDGVLAMYHDQGLAPMKALSMDDGVNFTAGLPFVRTSPDHGVASDIAGKGQASETSLRTAIYEAIDIYRHRKAYDEAHANPLPKLYRTGREDERPHRPSSEKHEDA